MDDCSVFELYDCAVPPKVFNGIVLRDETDALQNVNRLVGRCAVNAHGGVGRVYRISIPSGVIDEGRERGYGDG